MEFELYLEDRWFLNLSLSLPLILLRKVLAELNHFVSHPNQNLSFSWMIFFLLTLADELFIFSGLSLSSDMCLPSPLHAPSPSYPWDLPLLHAMYAYPWWYLSDYIHLNLLIRNNFRSTEVCKEFLYTLYPSSLNIDIVYNLGAFVKTKNWYNTITKL